MRIPKSPSWGFVFLAATLYQIFWGQKFGYAVPLTCLLCWAGKQLIDRHLERLKPVRVRKED